MTTDKISGFTLVELMTAIVVSTITLSIFYVALFDTFKDTATTNKIVQATTDIKRAFSILSVDTVLTANFRKNVPTQYPDSYGPHRMGTSGSEAWLYNGDSADSRVLILENFSTTQNAGGSNRRPVYINSSSYNCTTNLTRQPKLTYIAIFFVYQQTLYKRTLTDNSQTLCPGQTQYQQRTCPPDLSGSWPAGCLARDEILATNVSKFQVAYYQSDSTLGGRLVPAQYISNNPNLLNSANIIQVTLEEDFAGLEAPVSITQNFARIN